MASATRHAILTPPAIIECYVNASQFVDMVVSIGHFTISIYKTLGQSLVIKIATVCIEAKDPSGLNFQQMNEIAEEGPEYAQRILLKE